MVYFVVIINSINDVSMRYDAMDMMLLVLM